MDTALDASRVGAFRVGAFRAGVVRVGAVSSGVGAFSAPVSRVEGGRGVPGRRTGALDALPAPSTKAAAAQVAPVRTRRSPWSGCGRFLGMAGTPMERGFLCLNRAIFAESRCLRKGQRSSLVKEKWFFFVAALDIFESLAIL